MIATVGITLIANANKNETTQTILEQTKTSLHRTRNETGRILSIQTVAANQGMGDTARYGYLPGVQTSGRIVWIAIRGGPHPANQSGWGTPESG